MITKELLKNFEASPVVRLEPLPLLLRKHHILIHLGLHGHIGESLKVEPNVAVEGALRPDALD